jgi:hypothetical protein
MFHLRRGSGSLDILVVGDKNLATGISAETSTASDQGNEHSRP